MLKNITPYEIINLLKSSVSFDGGDVNVSLNQLITVNHNIHPDELVSAITEIPDVQISDRGIIIPGNYFE